MEWAHLAPKRCRYEESEMELRPYQAAALAGVKEHFAAGRKRVIVCLACGSGKTRLAAEAVRHSAEKGYPVL